MEAKPTNLVVLFHIGGLVHFWYSNYYMYRYVNMPVSIDPLVDSLLGKFRFLTVWNLVLLAGLFLVCCLRDITETWSSVFPSTIRTSSRKLRDFMVAMSFFLSTVVATSFWGLYSIDRELIFPRAIDDYFPLWLNHAMHTNIIFFVIVESFISHTTYPSRRLGLSLIFAVGIFYIICIHIVHAYTGTWIYPFLKVFNAPMKAMWYALLLAIGAVGFLTGEKLNDLVWIRKSSRWATVVLLKENGKAT